MRIKLTLRRPEERLTDLEVTADATATVSDVADALYLSDPLRSETEAPEGLTLQVQEPGSRSSDSVRTLDRNVDLIQAGLRSGTAVSLARSGEAYTTSPDRGAPVALLRVLSGPERGREYRLPAGSTVIGRSSQADLRIKDPMMSKRHVRVNIGTTIDVVDLGSANGMAVAGRPTERATLAPSDVLAMGDSTVSIIALHRLGGSAPNSPVVEFNRSPRVVPRFPADPIDLPEPPKRPQPIRFPVPMLIAPLFMGLLMFAVRGSIFSLMFMLMMPMMAIAMYIDRKYQTKRQLEDQIKEFNEGMVSAKKRMTDAQEVERAVRLVETPSVADTVDSLTRMGRLLWTNRPEHRQFLTLRLGLGTAKSRLPINAPNNKDTLPEFRDELLDVKEEYAWVAGVPIVADLRESGAVGVAGTGSAARSVARGLAIQLIGLHSPAELAIAAITSPSSRAEWEWLKWIPHTSSPHSPLEGDHLADGPAGGTNLMARLEELVEDRLEGNPTSPRGALDPEKVDVPEPLVPGMVVIVEDDAPVDRARLVRLAERGADAGIHIMWVSAGIASLPAVCRTHILVDDQEGLAVSGHVRLGERYQPVVPETVDAETATGLARHLSPVVDAGVPIDDDSDLPRSISFVRLVGPQLAEDPQAVVDRWHETGSIAVRDGSAPVRRKHAAPLAGLVGHNGAEPFQLDLRTNGPHALVGGTTGAGKSEFLQAWVLGMALHNSPDRLTFLFVDYKGGAAFSECIHLPHAVGLVTDLSTHLVRRALTSLRAELHYREDLLNQKKAKDLVSLEKTGDPDCPPSLVIVVDEFAALANEVPEFVDGVVDVAARGRSLGLHLILATQRPAGVIKDNLRANTNLRIALRMADEPDSADVLGDKMAAHFDPSIPGRAAAKTGPGRITTFQTGYAGGWTTDEPEQARIDIVEHEFSLGAQWEMPAPVGQPRHVDPGPTDIARLVTSMQQAGETARIPEPRKPWLAEMAEIIDLAALPESGTDEDLVLGSMDVPERQAQPTFSYVPDRDGNMAVFGTGGSGKSGTLRSIAVAAAETPDGGPVHVYGLDFGASGLKMLEDLPHVGAIISGDDEERVIRLLRTLRETVDRRSDAFARVQAGSLREYRKLADRPGESRILLLVDGMAAFREAYDFSNLQKWFTTFVQIAADGRQVGVHVIVTADRPNAVPSTLGSSIQKRIIHRMASADDYLAFGEKNDVLDAASPPGRGIMDGHEVQVAIIGGDANVSEQSRRIGDLADRMRRAGVGPAPGVARLPEDVRLGSLRRVVDGLPVIGVGDETLQELTLEPRGPFMITGPARSGRTTAIVTLATGVRALNPPMRTIRFSARRSAIGGSGLWDAEASDLDECRSLAQDLTATFEGGGVPEGTVTIVIESVADFSGNPAEGALEKLVRAAVRSGQFVVGENESTTWSQSYTLSQPFKGGRTGLFLAPSEGEVDSLLGTPVGRVRRADFPPGRGFLVSNGRAFRVQVARPDEL